MDDLAFKQNVLDKIRTLQDHFVNLMIEVQGISSVMRDTPYIQQFMERTEKPIKIDADELKNLIKRLNSLSENFSNLMKECNISQYISETKYIGNRLLNIELLLKEIKQERLTMKYLMNLNCDAKKLL